MKRILVGIILTAMLFAMTGCSGGANEENKVESGDNTTKVAGNTGTESKPSASFTVSPQEMMPVSADLTFDASGSSDETEDADKLEVRWDWEGDGKWDTPFSAEKKVVHSYPAESTYSVLMEVKNSKGTTEVAKKQVIVGQLNWKPFSDDSPWNQKIPAGAKTDPQSDELLKGLTGLYINMSEWSIPVYYVDSEKVPKYNVTDSRPGIYGDGFKPPNQIPIPDGAIAAGPQDGDNHMSIIDKKKNIEWGMWLAKKSGEQWSTGLGAVTDLSGTGVRPPVSKTEGFASHTARASGFPLIAGLIRVDEIKQGHIDHALVFAYQNCRSEYFISPASTAQVRMLQINHNSGIPMGGRIQLDPSFDVENSGLSETGKIITRALQEYGAYCGDYAGATVLYAESSPQAMIEWTRLGFSNNELAEVFNDEAVRKNFRVIDMGKLIKGQNYEEY